MTKKIVHQNLEFNFKTHLKNAKIPSAKRSKTTEVKHKANVMIETACLTFLLVSSSLRISFCEKEKLLFSHHFVMKAFTRKLVHSS